MDAGQRVVERLYKELFIDDQWSVRGSGEFTWWPHHLPQRVWCEPARDDAGFGVARVCAESRLFRDVPDGSDTLAKVAALNAFATTSAYLVNDDRTITSRCAVYVHEETVDLAVHLMRIAAAIQASDAYLKMDAATAFGAVPDSSPHPSGGWRQTPDDMLNAIALFAREGRAPSRFTEEFGDVADMLSDAGMLATASDHGLVVELPCLGAVPAAAGGQGTAMLEVLDLANPQMGHGAFMTLQLPVSFSDGAEMANELNRTESHPDAFTKAHLLGGWCSREDDAIYVSFMPALAYRPGLLLALVASMASRARFVGELLQDTADELSA